LGKYYQQKQLAGGSRLIHPDKSGLMDTIRENLIAVVTVCICFCLNSEMAQTLVGSLQNLTPIYIVLSAIWIYLFARRKGLITKLLSNKLLIYLGNISTACYLIHYVVIIIHRLIFDLHEYELECARRMGDCAWRFIFDNRFGDCI
jgi:peptidoglycan/LPS O-acetylase OafA/YrhL